jgi:CheY-like chemotaxis protein
MPKMIGPEATRQMRALGYTGLIVGVTGNSLQADIDFFLESGADRVFIKPLEVEKFTSYLRDKLDLPNLK